MQTLLKIEMVGLLGLSVFLFSQTDFVWWWYLVLFFVPDIGMVGYLVNTKIGAFTYNLMHHLAVSALLLIAGTLLALPFVYLAGVIMLGHSAFDRVVGYGLKYSDNFKHTHLGELK